MLKYLQNLHTHTSFCDGKDTPEEMVLTAIDKGFTSLGFSGHSYMHFALDYAMSIEGTQEYKKEIARLKQKYADKIEIFCGIEHEKYSEIDRTGYDYLIGSVHYIYKNGEYLDFDRPLKKVQEIIAQNYGGKAMDFVKDYYYELASLPKVAKFDIIGHFDIITKNIELGNLFDVNSKEYLNYAFEAIDALKNTIPLFEINTGAIARGYRTTPYPTAPIIKRLLEKGFLPVISSDCHNKNNLDCYFKEAEELLKSCGAKEKYVLTKNGFTAIPLE